MSCGERAHAPDCFGRFSWGSGYHHPEAFETMRATRTPATEGYCGTGCEHVTECKQLFLLSLGDGDIAERIVTNYVDGVNARARAAGVMA